MTKPIRFATTNRFSQKRRNQQTRGGQGAGAVFSVPAPTLGLNTRNDYHELRPNEARELENLLPDIGVCKVRPGHTDHATLGSSSTDVQGLIEYKGTSSRKLIATAGGEVHDASSASPSLLTSSENFSSNRWRMANFNGWLFAVNATDDPWRYDGGASVDTTTGFSGSGLTLSDLANVAVVRNRLWFAEKDSADVWYGPIGGVTGSLTKFQLSQIADGGRCTAIGSWSRDAGDGADDTTIFVMDTGQAIEYQGDPASTFSLVGKYMMPEPVGRGCLVKVGGELIVMTRQGPVPVSAAKSGVAFDFMAIGAWGKIAPSWKDDFETYGNGDAWTALYANGIIYFSFPTSSASNASKQYVFNTRRSAWTTYTGLPASSWGTLNNDVYIGEFSSGNIYEHTGRTDDGSMIQCKGRSGFTYPVGQTRNVAVSAMKPNIDTDGTLNGTFTIDVDFIDSDFPNTLYTFLQKTGGADWGDAWGSDWGEAPETVKRWYGAQGYGRAIGVGVKLSSSATNAKWYSTDVMGIPGGPL